MMNMKKALALLLALVMVLGMFPVGVFAEETPVEAAGKKTHLETCLEGCTGMLEGEQLCECDCHYRHLETCLEGCTGVLENEEVCECDCHFEHLETCLEDCAEEDCECACHLHSELCVENCQGETKTGEKCDCTCHEVSTLNLDKPVQKEPSEETAQKDPEEETEEETEEEKTVCVVCQKADCTATHVFCEVCQKYDCGVTHVFCEVCQKYDCGVTHVFCETCQKYDCGVTHVFCQLCQKNDCGVTHVFCETCQKYDCGIDHAAEKAQQTDPVTCICGLAENHEGDCLECECGLVKNHEGDCLENPAAIVETTVTEYADKDTKVEIAGMMPGNVQLFLEDVEVPAALMEDTAIEDEHIAFSLDISLGTVQESSSVFGLLRGVFGAAPEVEEWQPEEGQPVTVTMDVKGCEDGNVIAVYHEDGEGVVELVDYCTVADGKITFEAKGFSVYTGILIHFQVGTVDNWYSVPYNVSKPITLKEILDGLGISLPLAPHRGNYLFTVAANTGNGQVTALDLFSDLGFVNDGSYNTLEGELITPNIATLKNSNYIVLNILDKESRTVLHAISIRSNQSAHNVFHGKDSMCFLYQDDKFYWYNEDTGEVLEELNFTALEETAYNGWYVFMYNHVKILMNDTYVAGKALEHMAEWKATIPARNTYEELVPGSGQTLTIERYPGFEDPLIRVEGNFNSPLNIEWFVTIDNKSPSDKNLTAIEVVNNVRDDGLNYGGLLIFYGVLKDSNVNLDDPSTYRGTGVYVTTSDESKRGGNVPKAITRGEGGILELENGATIQGFEYGVKQDYGTTAITYRYPGIKGVSNTYYGMNLASNTHSIALYHNNRIEKWSTFASGIPDIKLFLMEIEKWDSGDIVMSSGYEWRKNTAYGGSRYDGDANPGYDHWWTPVSSNDATKISFQNGNDLQYAMGLNYDNPYPADSNISDRFRDPSKDPFHDPYPVLRFVRYTVYNVNKQTWYFTLGEAVAASSPNDVLVFYGDTQESGMVKISHNLTIRSSYLGEKPWSTASGAFVEDERAGGDYTARWLRTDGWNENGEAVTGTAIRVQNSATVNFEGTIDVNGTATECGKLTFDADNKGRVMDMWGDSTVNIEDGITLTKGYTATYGGAVWNVAGTLNISGGTFSNNTAGLGDAIYQDGTLNLSGAPKFANNGQEDIYLPATATDDTSSNAFFKVITKGGSFTFTSPIKVTLGMDNTNLYDGRNVVESGRSAVAKEILETDLKLFDLTNDNVTGGIPDTENMESFAFVYEDKDASNCPNKGRDVLELDIRKKIHRGDLKIEKILIKEDTSDTDPVGPFTFLVTFKNTTEEYTYKTFTKVNGVETEVTGPGKSGSITSGGTLSIDAGHYVVIEDIEIGAFEVKETNLDDEVFYAPVWSTNTAAGDTANGTITKDAMVHVTCTNTKLAKTAVLKLTKKVVKDYDNDADPTDQYTFTIDFAGTGKTATYKIDTNTEQNLNDGGTITLSNGQTATITMPVGAYTITETNPGDKFRNPTWSDGVTVDTANNYKVSGTLTANETESVICTNHYTKQVRDLVITKTVSGNVPDAPAFVFHVTGAGVDMYVTIAFNASETEKRVTIKDLPLGTYTVTEDTGWAAKYTVGSATQIASVTAQADGAVSFTNTRKTKWLTWDTNAKNLFDGDLTT